MGLRRSCAATSILPSGSSTNEEEPSHHSGRWKLCRAGGAFGRDTMNRLPLDSEIGFWDPLSGLLRRVFDCALEISQALFSTQTIAFIPTLHFPGKILLSIGL